MEHTEGWQLSDTDFHEEYMALLNQVYNTEQAVTPYDGAQYEDGRYVGNGLDSWKVLAIENF